MTPEEGKKIFSNEYADFFISYYTNESILEKYKDAAVQIMSLIFAIVHVPVQQITDKTILQMGYSAIPTLSGIVSLSSIEASGIPRIRKLPKLNLRGKGVLIGIVDTGIDYTNPVFINADNTTKIISIWDQSIPGENYSSNTYYGTAYTREQINQALLSDNPYDIVPSRDEIGHGTMLAGIAAGNEVPEKGFYGVAPDAELVVVKLKPAKPYLKEFWRIPQDAVCFQENDILFGIEYLEQTAIQLNRPLSICLALGTSLSSHGGRGVLTNYLSIFADDLNYSLCIAAGNEGNARRHYYGVVNPAIGFDQVELTVGENEGDFSIALWGDSFGLFAIDITSPTGEYVPKVVPRMDVNKDVTFIFDQTRILIDYQIIESQSGDELILLRFTKPTSGIWVFKVYGSGDLSLSYHMWLPISGFISDNTYFIKSNPNTTIVSLGNSINPITVTAYNDVDGSLYQNAGRGYTRTGIIKPEIAAPGVNIISPTLEHGYAAVTGTSPAVAHTAGVAAMILEWGIVEGNLPYISTEDIKILMIRGAKRNPGLIYPNPDWGYGILDVYNIFNSLRSGVK